MKQPTVIVDGVEHKVRDVTWHKDGSLANISLVVDGEFKTLFPPYSGRDKWNYPSVDGNEYHDVQFKEGE